MGFFHKKNKKGRPSSVISQEPLTHTKHYSPSIQSKQTDYSVITILEDKDKKYKRIIRILRFVSRFISLILAACMVGVFGYSLAQYYMTRKTPLPLAAPVPTAKVKDRNLAIRADAHDPNTTTAWPEPTVLWPTFMMLSISFITFCMNMVTLVSYCIGVGAANKTSNAASYVGYTLTAIHVLVWLVATSAMKACSMKGDDLWGYTCSSRADEIEAQVKSFVNFGKLCDAQGYAWYASVIQTALYFLAFVTTILVARRASHKKKINRARQSLHLTDQGHSPQLRFDGKPPPVNSPPGLAPYYNPYMVNDYDTERRYDDQESGMVFANEGPLGSGKTGGRKYMPVSRDTQL